MKKKLMIIISDRLSNIINKGEITERYYNPGNYFDEVHIVMTNDDRVNIEDISKTVGKAKLYLYNIPADKSFFFSTLGWRPVLLNRWSKAGVKLAADIKPDLIRCYGNRLSGYLGYQIKKAIGIPYILSMHEYPDDIVKVENRFFRTIQYKMISSVAKVSLQNANIVVCVYDSITAYLERMKVKRYRVIYNAINTENIIRKEDYGIDNIVKIISIGRLILGKNPVNLIKAVSKMERVKLTIVGTGNQYDNLIKLVKILKCEEKVEFIPSMENNYLCSTLHSYDIFAAHCDYNGIPKAVMEPLFAGLPVVINKPKFGKVKEYEKGDFLVLVENSEEAYLEALTELIHNRKKREELGKKAHNNAKEKWDRKKIEQEYNDLYNEILGSKNNEENNQ